MPLGLVQGRRQVQGDLPGRPIRAPFPLVGFDAGLHLGIPGFAGGYKEAGGRAAGSQAQAVAAFAAAGPS